MNFNIEKIEKSKKKYLEKEKKKNLSEKIEILGEMQERFYWLNKKKKKAKPWNFK